jgi:hypothetical protein
MLSIVNSALFAWGLLALLMVMLALMAFLRKRQLVKERFAILIIGMILLLALLALTVNVE